MGKLLEAAKQNKPLILSDKVVISAPTDLATDIATLKT